MSLTVETGAVVNGTTGADSYVAVADADTYWAGRVNAADWAKLSTTQKEAALREACQYLDVAYKWIGKRLWIAQPLYWPRLFYLANDDQRVEPNTIPQQVKNAQCELALLAASSKLAPERDGQKVASEQVGPLAVSYFQTDPARVFPMVDLLLRDFTYGKTLGGFVSQAVLS